MAFCRIFNFGISKFLPTKKVFGRKEIIIGPAYFITSERYARNNLSTVLRVLKCRRKIAGAERERRRNEWDNWNYKSELYAFSHRLQENISEETLRQAFVHESYIQKEEQKRKELDMLDQDMQLDLKSNSSLIASGEDVINKYLERYLPYCFPKLPYEGINALHKYLISDEVLSHISFNIGTKDLIFCSEYPPENPILSATFKAIVGSIATDDSIPRAENFVLDFVCPQLVGQDVLEIWDLENPLGALNDILLKHGLEECEPRLIFEAGRTTLEAVYLVGLYSNKQFLGRGPGETVDVAVEMAAYNTLRKLFGIHDNERPLYFGDKARSLDLSAYRKPLTLSEWKSETLKEDLRI